MVRGHLRSPKTGLDEFGKMKDITSPAERPTEPIKKAIENIPEPEEETPLKLTPTSKNWLRAHFGMTASDLQVALREGPTYHVKAPGRQTFLNAEIALETVSKSWVRPGDRRFVDGYLVIGVRPAKDFQSIRHTFSKYTKPILVLP